MIAVAATLTASSPHSSRRRPRPAPITKIFDLTRQVPLLTTKQKDESKQQWDKKDETGLRFAPGVVNVEYYRDIKPILERSCVACHAANEMSVGEMRQLTSYDALDFTEADYYRLIAAKTASLMSAACEMGAIAGAPECREALARYGHNLGMAFQIADDLLDYTGTESVTGKPTGHDLRERKVTLPLVDTLARTTDEEEREIRAFFTRVDPTDDEIARIVEIVVARGGLQYAARQAGRYADLAVEALAEVPEGPATDALRDAVRYAVDRRR